MIQQTFSTFLLLVVLKISEGNRITIGKDAEIQCQKFKKSCTEGNLCVIQHLQWPMNMSFPICIPESEISVKLRICQKPPAPGNCGARWVRWYFNTNIQRCSWFYYQGCRGNENNFKSKSECEAECVPNQQTNIIEKPLIYDSVNPVVVTEPIQSPDYSNYVDRAYSLVRSKDVGEFDREVRRKRRLEKRRQKRLRKLMRKRRKSLQNQKRRREGKVNNKGGKKKRKNKNKNKNNKGGKRGKKNKKSKGEKSTITFIPGDEISEANRDLMKKLVEKESSTVKQGDHKRDGKS